MSRVPGPIRVPGLLLPRRIRALEVGRWGLKNRIHRCLKILRSYGGAARSEIPRVRQLETLLASNNWKPDKVPFVYHVCNDVEAIRHFYVDLLGMQQAAHMDTPEFGFLSLECGGLQMMWFRADEVLPVPNTFACQPGWAGGTREVSSFSVFLPEEDFAAAFARLQDAGATMFESSPAWRQDSYWGLSVLDPMGATVEVYTSPKDRPGDTSWPS